MAGVSSTAYKSKAYEHNSRSRVFLQIRKKKKKNHQGRGRERVWAQKEKQSGKAYEEKKRNIHYSSGKLCQKNLNKRPQYQRTFVSRDDVYHIILYYIIYRYTLEQLQMIYVRL